MKRLISALRNIRPIKILTVFFVGVFLVFAQACAPTTASEGPGGANSEMSVPKGDKVLNQYEGGMNNFSDTDPRSKEARTDVKVKTEELKENAERNVIDQTGNLGENTRRILDKKGENAADFGKNLQKNAEGTADKTANSADNFAKGVKRGIDNIQDNTKDAAKDLGKNVQRTAEDAKTSVQRTANDAGDAVKRTVREAD